MSWTERVHKVRRTHPDNLMARHLPLDWARSLPEALGGRLQAICRSGLEQPDSHIGCYAHRARDYDDFARLFLPVIEQEHGLRADEMHRSDWGSATRAEAVDSWGLGAVSCRVRVARNFADLPLPAAMEAADRIELERRAEAIAAALSAQQGESMAYHALTPGHPCEVAPDQVQRWVDLGIAFKDMRLDPYLQSAGIADAWPLGRGLVLSPDRQIIVWIGEEDHLRIICKTHGGSLFDLLASLRTCLETIERAVGASFSQHPRLGNVTSCPSNLGTGLRASVHVALPRLLSCHGRTALDQQARELGLAIRGVRGEHSSAGSDGTLDVSPRRRLGVTEVEIIETLHEGMVRLAACERQTPAHASQE